MPKAPLPEAVAVMLRHPNPAVIAVVMPSGHPMSVATWYLLEDDGTIMVNMDARRARLSWIEQHPHVSLTVLKDDEWYTHVSVRGPVVRWEHDEAKALADIDRLARHYTGKSFGTRDALRVSAWIRVEHWHGWDLDATPS
jgi:PPOX class probable F420-dependent enzyme